MLFYMYIDEGGETDLKQLNHQFFSYYRCVRLSRSKKPKNETDNGMGEADKRFLEKMRVQLNPEEVKMDQLDSDFRTGESRFQVRVITLRMGPGGWAGHYHSTLRGKRAFFIPATPCALQRPVCYNVSCG